MKKNFLLSKKIDPSALKRGFAIPVYAQEIFSCYLSGGRLAHGEKRTVTIFLDGKRFDVILRSVRFNKKDYPNRSEMWQINWSLNDAISKKVTEIFFKSYTDDAEDGEYFVLYSTDKQDVFHFEPIFNHDILIPKISELALENLLELPILTDDAATLIARCNLMKIREMTLSRGQSIGEFYGVDLVDCHHIAPFSQSLNNDQSNLLIVCPNHHRIIHAANPTFDRKRKLYLYPNGREEILQINEHL